MQEIAIHTDYSSRNPRHLASGLLRKGVRNAALPVTAMPHVRNVSRIHRLPIGAGCARTASGSEHAPSTLTACGCGRVSRRLLLSATIHDWQGDWTDYVHPAFQHFDRRACRDPAPRGGVGGDAVGATIGARLQGRQASRGRARRRPARADDARGEGRPAHDPLDHPSRCRTPTAVRPGGRPRAAQPGPRPDRAPERNRRDRRRTARPQRAQARRVHQRGPEMADREHAPRHPRDVPRRGAARLRRAAGDHDFPVPIGLASTWDPASGRARDDRRGRGSARPRRASTCCRRSSTSRAIRAGAASRKPTARIRTW